MHILQYDSARQRKETLPSAENTDKCTDLEHEGPLAENHKHLLMSLRGGIQRLIQRNSFRKEKPIARPRTRRMDIEAQRAGRSTQEVSEGKRCALRSLDDQKGPPPLHWLLQSTHSKNPKGERNQHRIHPCLGVMEPGVWKPQRNAQS